MNNTYITALIDSLSKKIEVLEAIHEKDEEQLRIAKTSPFSYEEFDKNSEEKGVLIYRLNKLDEGFELVYEKVREELSSNKESYKSEIKKMQELITRITDLSTKIQAEEVRNKAAMEKAFKSEKDRLKAGRSGIKAVKSYTQTMRGGAAAPYYGLMDTKK